MPSVTEQWNFALAYIKTLTGCVGQITNAMIAAGTGIAATKLQHQHKKTYSQPNTTTTAETRIIHVVYGLTAQVLDFRAGSIAVAVGGATVTVDLKKNGTTILTAVITLNSSSVTYVAQAAGITSPNLVAGDVLTIVTTATAGGGTIPTGFFCELTLTEDPV